MQIGIMRVLMVHRQMAMRVRMRLADRAVVIVPVVLIMRMAVVVLQRIVHMLVLMALGQMQPEPHGHEASRQQQ